MSVPALGNPSPPSPLGEDQPAPPPISPPPRKPPIRLQERRGSSVSLLLDVSSLGAESVCSVSTPKEVWLQLLHTSSRPLTHTLLQHAATDTHTLNTEYQKIPPNFVSAAELDVPGHAVKDRYKTILPNLESRVVLRSPEEEAGSDRYINANYIRGYKGVPKAYIATQGPMLHTVADFWDMVWQERSSVIVMVTRLKEKNEKCELYWPEASDRREVNEEEEREVGGQRGRYGRFLLTVRESREKDGFTITDMEIQLSSERRPVRHYWFSSWPDHNIPQCTAPLLQLVEEVETYRKSLLPSNSEPIIAPVLSHGPIIVHCSAGIGRTGCFLASSIGCQQLRETGQVDILETVCQLRLNRGGMIQTTEQYQFLYATMAQYSLQLQHNQSQEPPNQTQEPNQIPGSMNQLSQEPNQIPGSMNQLSQEPNQIPGSMHQLSSQLQNIQLENSHKPHQNLQN